ncbi:hypothetical protein HAX54_017548 [Datura stramonium]|uniref:Uncharacterized protein n=1 Tax=Datura stramonium TaxID=4076 RepID=A0ABS8UN29_DATST|nr:hypothetical protein [Datura stramonium]
MVGLYPVISVKGQSRSVIIIPENALYEGWGSLITKVENFIKRKAEKNGEPITIGELKLNSIIGKGNYKEALHTALYASVLLGGCGGEDAPTHDDVKRWFQHTWKGAQNVQGARASIAALEQQVWCELSSIYWEVIEENIVSRGDSDVEFLMQRSKPLL